MVHVFEVSRAGGNPPNWLMLRGQPALGSPDAAADDLLRARQECRTKDAGEFSTPSVNTSAPRGVPALYSLVFREPRVRQLDLRSLTLPNKI